MVSSREDRCIRRRSGCFQSIAEQLGETEPNPLRQIKVLVEVCGVEFAQTILEETQQIEASNGWLAVSSKQRCITGEVVFSWRGGA